MQIISVINQKGGVGKSTTAYALASGLSIRGYKVLLIDSDPQSNVTYITTKERPINDLYSVYNGADISDAITEVNPNLYLIGGNETLASADIVYTDTGREYKLKKAIEQLQGNYDYIIIDTPPSLGILTINALTASTGAIVPAQADIFSIQGLTQLYDTIKVVREYTNPNLKILGILRTRHNPRTILSSDTSEMLEELASKIDTKVYKTYIRESVAIKESQAIRQSLFEYAPTNNAVVDYINFIDEVLEK